MFHACRLGYGDVVQYLLFKGADATTSDQWEWTCLMEALWRSHDHIVAMLISHGVQPDLDNPMWDLITALYGESLGEIFFCLQKL